MVRKTALFILVFITAITAGSFVSGQTLSQANAAIKNLQSNYTTLSGKLTTTQSSLKSTTDSLTVANKRVAALQTLVGNLQTKIRLDSLYYIARMGVQDKGLQTNIDQLASSRRADSSTMSVLWLAQNRIDYYQSARTDSLSKIFVNDTLQVLNGYSNKVAPHFYQISLLPITANQTPKRPIPIPVTINGLPLFTYADLPHTTKKLKPIK